MIQKTIIDLARFPSHLDGAFSQTGNEKSDLYQICGIWDHPRINPVLKSSCIIKQLNLKVWPSALECTQSSIRRELCKIIFGLHVSSCINVPVSIWTRKDRHICVQVRLQNLKKSSRVSPPDDYFPHWSSVSWCVAKRHNTSYCSINTKGLIPSQMCVNA